MSSFIPNNHYWIHSDGVTVYSSNRKIEVQINDETYLAWLLTGNTPTAYPKDESGNENAEELAAVLAIYGLCLTEEDEICARTERDRCKRDGMLDECQWMVNRHKDEVELGMSTSLSAGQYGELLSYRQALREMPGDIVDSSDWTWPVVPGFVVFKPLG